MAQVARWVAGPEGFNLHRICSRQEIDCIDGFLAGPCERSVGTSADEKTLERCDPSMERAADRLVPRFVELVGSVLTLLSPIRRVLLTIFELLTATTLLGSPVAAESQATPPRSTGEAFTLKLLRRTGENFFSSLAYECNDCSFEQFKKLRAPRGWSKSPMQIILPDGEIEGQLSFDGVPGAVDLIPEIPGDEFKLIAKNLESEIIKIGFSGIMLKSKVRRNTVLRYAAGTRIHELTDAEGDRYVLFAYEVESADFDRSVFDRPDAMSHYPRPWGWSYSSRILEEDLELKSEGVVTVLAIRAKTSSVWERR